MTLLSYRTYSLDLIPPRAWRWGRWTTGFWGAYVIAWHLCLGPVELTKWNRNTNWTK
jgi:hypothetical protein